MNKILMGAAALSLLSLTACGGGTLPHVSAEGAECRQMGFQTGTQEYTACLMELDTTRGQAPIVIAKATDTDR
ncbi:MAG: hypothetical protein AAGF48_10175 [Pseudomonadota bacterium]